MVAIERLEFLGVLGSEITSRIISRESESFLLFFSLHKETSTEKICTRALLSWVSRASAKA